MWDLLEQRLNLAAYGPDVLWASAGHYTDPDPAVHLQTVGLQADHRLLVRDEKGVFRLNADGTRDKTWNVVPAGPESAVSQTPGGFIYVHPYGVSFQTSVTRYKPDGAIDSRFGVDGSKAFAFADSPIEGKEISGIQVRDVVETEQGGIVVMVRVNFEAGEVYEPSILVLTKLDSRGRIDRAFGAAGSLVLPAGQWFEVDMGIDRYGRISLSRNIGSDTLQVQRFNIDGTPDRRLDGDGTIDFDTRNELADGADSFGPTYVPVHFARDGSFYYRDIHATGRDINFSGIRRRDSSGALDTSYGRGGWLRGLVRPFFEADGGVRVLGEGTVAHFTPAGLLSSSVWPSGVVQVPTAFELRRDAPLLFDRNGIYGAVGRGVSKLAPQSPIRLAASGILHLVGTDGDDAVSVRPTDRGLRVQVGSTVKIVRGTVRAIEAVLGGGNDTFQTKTTLNATVFGDEGNDWISLRGNASIAYGGLGNDTLLADGGDDVLYGNEGDDILDPGPGRDRVLGGPGRDRLLTREGTAGGSRISDYVDGGNGRDTVLADDEDELFGIEVRLP